MVMVEKGGCCIYRQKVAYVGEKVVADNDREDKV